MEEGVPSKRPRPEDNRSEGSPSEGEQCDEADIKIKFVDSEYVIPGFAIKEMPRLRLLKRDYPKATEFQINELDGGRFKRLLEDTTIPPVDLIGFAPEKSDAAAGSPQDTAFFDFAFAQMVANDGKLASVSNANTMSCVASVVPIDSPLDDITFSVTTLRSKHHDPQVPNSVLCPLKWWIKHASHHMEHSFVVQALCTAKHRRIHEVIRHYGMECFIRMYVACFEKSHLISITISWTIVK
jgi:hypothetical protein